jgi:hypothetical protein
MPRKKAGSRIKPGTAKYMFLTISWKKKMRREKNTMYWSMKPKPPAG